MKRKTKTPFALSDINGVNYDNKCINHPKQDILFVCSNCDNQPICSLCSTSKDHHRGHNFDDIDIELATKLFNEFKENINELNNEVLVKDIKLGEESSKRFNQLEQEHHKNLEEIKSEFKKLHLILDTVEKDSIRQLITHLDDNQEIHLKVNSQIESNKSNIKTITDKHKDKLETYNINTIFNNNNKEQLFEIIKHNQLSKTILNNKLDQKEVLGQYNTIRNEFNDRSITLVKDSIKTVHSIKKPTNNFDYGQIKFNDILFTVYHDGHTFGRHERNIALGPNVTDLRVGTIPNNIINVLILDGFSLELSQNLLPNSVTSLYIGEVEKPLQDPIPNSVKNLYLIDGFNQEMETKHFNQTLQSLFIGDTVNKIISSSVPPSVNTISKSPNYKHGNEPKVRITHDSIHGYYTNKKNKNWDYPLLEYIPR